eukprot:5130787-Prymnesium_polylepis.1
MQRTGLCAAQWHRTARARDADGFWCVGRCLRAVQKVESSRPVESMGLIDPAHVRLPSSRPL